LAVEPKGTRNRATSVKDVAKLAGVSGKTVSNVVNGYVHVTPEMRARVQRAIDALNYRPNPTAQLLRRGQTGIITLAVPRLDVPYFAELAGLIVRAADELGYTVLVDQTEGQRDRELALFHGDRRRLYDGVIYSPLALGRSELIARRDVTPLVLLGERVSGGPADHIAIDNVAAAAMATEHLVAIGRRRIAAIGHQPNASGETAHLRLQGYRQALEAAGIAPQDSLIAPATQFDRPSGARAMTALLEAHSAPDGLFCFNDLLAFGAMRVLHDHGIRVPDDIAIVGFDDVDEAAYGVPSLTSISPDKAEIAAQSVRRLLNRMRHDDGPPQEIVVAHRLQIRETTAGTGTQAKHAAPETP
jgi:DNA-binding LacI/PurR family transcriptional regulator